MRSRGLVPFTVVLLLLALGVAPAQEPVKLELRSHPGERLTYAAKLGLEGTVLFPNPGKPGTTLTLAPEIQGEATLQQITKSVAANGSLDLGLKVDSFDLTLKLNNIRASFGIAGEAAGSTQLIKLPEIPLTMTLTPQGQIVGLKGLGDLVSKLMPAKPPLPMTKLTPLPAKKPAPAKKPTAAAKKPAAKPAPKPVLKPTASMPSPADIEVLVNLVLQQVTMPVFQVNPVKPGDEWKAERKLPIPGTPLALPIRQTCRFVGMESAGQVEAAHVDVTTEVDMAMPPNLEAKVLANTALFLDPAMGRVVKKEDKGKLTFRVSFAAGGPGLAAGELAKADLTFHGEAELIKVE